MQALFEQCNTKSNKPGDEHSFDDMTTYVKKIEIILKNSEITTKSILRHLERLKIDEQELRESSDFPFIVSHLNVNQEVVFKIFEGKLKLRFKSTL